MRVTVTQSMSQSAAYGGGRAQGSTAYLSCVPGSRRTTTMTVDMDLPLPSSQDGEPDGSGGWAAAPSTDQGDTGDGGRAAFGAGEEPDRGLLTADNLLYDGTGKRRIMRFWRRS